MMGQDIRYGRYHHAPYHHGGGLSHLGGILAAGIIHGAAYSIGYWIVRALPFGVLVLVAVGAIAWYALRRP